MTNSNEHDAGSNTQGSARLQLYLARTHKSTVVQMNASIRDHVYAVRAVRDVPHEHIVNILLSLESIGFDVHTKREATVLPYIDVDSLPFLDASEREVFKEAATGKLLGLSLRLCTATPATRRRRHNPGSCGQQTLCLNQLPCNVFVMQGNHGVVRSDVGDRRAGTGGLSGGWGETRWGRHTCDHASVCCCDNTCGSVG